ncbi:hypothetical protein KAU11_04485 [Candidatus Babeliales bacterium]|nr:hypothetical protein [Candidatus Babeliales bacterium]
MAGITKVLNFSEGVSTSGPVTTFLQTNQFQTAVDDAAFVTAKGSAAADGDVYYDTTLDVVKVYANGAWQSLYDDSDANVALLHSIQTFSGAKTFSAVVTVSNATSSTTKDNGSIVTEGGVGIEENLNVGGNAVIAGNLTVSGTTTTVDTAELDVTDSNITINSGGTQSTADTNDAGLTVDMSDATNALIHYDSTAASKWKVGELGSTVEVTDLSSSQVITNKDIDGTTASNTSRLTFPKDTTSNLNALTRKAGTVVYDTTLDKFKGDNGTTLVEFADVSGGGSAVAVGMNRVLNSSMLLTQRADYTSATAVTSGTYYFDMFKASFDTIASCTVQQITVSQPTGVEGTKSMKYVAGSTATGRMGCFQTLENPSRFKGKGITVSAYIKSDNSDARLGVWDGVGWNMSSAHAGDGNWARLDVSFTTSASATVLDIYPRIMTAAGATVSITSSDFIEITGVKLEFGLFITEFQVEQLGEDLTACQRFFQKSINFDSYSYSSTSGYIQVANNGVMLSQAPGFKFKGDMAGTPTVTIYRIVNGLAGSVYIVTTGGTVTATPSGISKTMVGYLALGAGAENGYNFHYKAEYNI